MSVNHDTIRADITGEDGEFVARLSADSRDVWNSTGPAGVFSTNIDALINYMVGAQNKQFAVTNVIKKSSPKS